MFWISKEAGNSVDRNVSCFFPGSPIILKLLSQDMPASHAGLLRVAEYFEPAEVI
jgi:hypothetical protein